MKIYPHTNFSSICTCPKSSAKICVRQPQTNLHSEKIGVGVNKNTGLELLEKQIKAEDATDADELFIAVSSKDIVPVVKFNEIQIADGKPGKYTKSLINEFAKLVKG
ncbi:MAG: hypothetical protein KKE40_01140 [Planctomycetes bacterium]|nr:hypothetical protein [Planctomycetota bacterium]